MIKNTQDSIYFQMLSPNDFINVHLKRLDNYVTGITSSTINCNRYEKLAVDRFLAHKEKYLYKEIELIKALKFFSLLQIQIRNEARQCDIMPFQLLWLASILALYRDENTVLYSQSFLLTAKKQSKSGFASLLSLYYALGKGIINSHVLLLSASREQARTLISYVEFIIKNSPALTPLFRINKNLIYNRTDKSNNRIEIRASEAEKIQGVGVSMGLSVIDEFSYHDNGELQQAVKSAQIAMPNHHQLIISTAANNLTNPAFELYESAKNILDGVIENDDLFTVIYTLDDKDEYKNPANYRKSNPALGYTITTDALQREVNSAIALPAKLETVMNHHFNVWMNQHQESFIDDAKIVSLMVDNMQIPSGSTVWLGGDFSSLNDLSALSVLWFDATTGGYVTKLYHIFPNNEKRRIKKGSIDLQRWIDEGYIIRCETPSLDENLVIDLIKEINTRYKIYNFGYDPYNSRILAQRLKNEIGIQCTEVRQNFTMSFPLKLIEKYMTIDKLHFDKSPVTRWQFQNLRVKTDRNNNYMLTKNAGESIDGIVALTIAMTCFLNDNNGRYENIMSLFEELQQVKQSA